MRTMHLAVPTGEERVMFPNGAQLGTVDVFMGAGFLAKIKVGFTGAGILGGDLTISVYNGVDGSVTPVNVIRRGSEFALVVAEYGESFVVEITAGGITDQGDPYSGDATPDDDVTDQQAILSAVSVSPSPTHIAEVPVNQPCPMGMAIVVNNATGIAADVWVDFEPWTSGGTRKRLAFENGSNTENATATSATATYLEDTGIGWTVNEWVGYTVWTEGSFGVVASNTAERLVLDANGWVGGTPATGTSTYLVAKKVQHAALTTAPV